MRCKHPRLIYLFLYSTYVLSKCQCTMLVGICIKFIAFSDGALFHAEAKQEVTRYVHATI